MTAAATVRAVDTVLGREHVPRLADREVPRHDARIAVLDAADEDDRLPGGRPRHRLGDIDADGRAPRIEPFSALPRLLRAGDLVVVNDAATLPGSLRARTAAGEPFELRLTGPLDAGSWDGLGIRGEAVALGRGDHRTRTEDRPPPPRLTRGDRLELAGSAGAPVSATVIAARGRRVVLAWTTTGTTAAAGADAVWQALYAAGAPIQYAHRPAALPLHAVQTAYAARPWAAEMPSAGRALTWEVLLGLRRAGIALARLTHAAGISSTGDAALDAALPWPERYEIPAATSAAIAEAHARGGRVIAIGTTVVRALEASGGAPGAGVATLRLDARTPLGVVDAIVSGLHVPGESHFDLLSAFAAPTQLASLLAAASAHGLSAHELGDACLVFAARRARGQDLRVSARR